VTTASSAECPPPHPGCHEGRPSTTWTPPVQKSDNGESQVLLDQRLGNASQSLYNGLFVFLLQAPPPQESSATSAASVSDDARSNPPPSDIAHLMGVPRFLHDDDHYDVGLGISFSTAKVVMSEMTVKSSRPPAARHQCFRVNNKSKSDETTA